jgi:nicotinic acid mononucleotide adenylyltransferase
MRDREIIKEIHSSDIKAKIVEVGCGTPIASELFSIAGASNTIYSVESPYSREAFDEKYGSIYGRAVSAERVRSVVNACEQEMIEEKYNTVVATSFQVGDETNRVATHGWIAISFNIVEDDDAGDYLESNTKFYHVSIHQPLKRQDYIKLIGEIGVLLLSSRNETIIDNVCVDIVLNEDLSFDKITTLKYIEQSRFYEQATVFKSNGIVDRLESITRGNDQLIYYKGSFNPIQNAHTEVIRVCKELYKNAYPVFAISVDTFQKGEQEPESILDRINLINQMGYDVVVLNNPLFLQNLKFIRNKFKGKVIFPMGLDTINRLVMDYIYEGKLHSDQMILDFANSQIVCLNRTGNEKNDLLLNTDVEVVQYVENFYHEISSTAVRKYLSEKNYDEVKKLVPEEIFDNIVKNWQ